ncbi:hypothetical protein J6590_085628 [Homalodisca vitripennis]|nr:hypothetical protein J6590_085628 [Homalodisca vitripennis]
MLSRRSHKPEEEAKKHDAAYTYKVRLVRDCCATEVPVCYKAFLSMFGIGKKKLQGIQQSLKMTGTSPKDNRGRHEKGPSKLDDDNHLQWVMVLSSSYTQKIIRKAIIRETSKRKITPQKKSAKDKEKEEKQQERKENLAAYKLAKSQLQPGEFLLPEQSHKEPLKISREKFFKT